MPNEVPVPPIDSNVHMGDPVDVEEVGRSRIERCQRAAEVLLRYSGQALEDAEKKDYIKRDTLNNLIKHLLNKYPHGSEANKYLLFHLLIGSTPSPLIEEMASKPFDTESCTFAKILKEFTGLEV